MIPLMSVDEASLCMISSASDKDYSELDHLDTVRNKSGELVFHSQIFSIVCNSCKELGIAKGCTHMENRKPWWQSGRKVDDIAAVQERNEADFERETLGVLSSSKQLVFPATSVQRVFHPEYRYTNSDAAVETVFMCIDPCGGWKNLDMPNKSDFAIISGYWGLNDTLVVCGGDLIPARDKNDYAYRIVKHAAALRHINGCANAKMVIIFENNSTTEASWIGPMLSEEGVGNFFFMEEREMLDGVATDDRVKRDMVFLLQQMFVNDRGRFGHAIRIHKDFFTTADPRLERDKNQPDAKGILKMISEQLNNYARLAKKGSTNRDPGTAVRYQYTAKHTGKDDGATALGLLAFWSRKYRSSEYGMFGAGNMIQNQRLLDSTERRFQRRKRGRFQPQYREEAYVAA